MIASEYETKLYHVISLEWNYFKSPLSIAIKSQNNEEKEKIIHYLLGWDNALTVFSSSKVILLENDITFERTYGEKVIIFKTDNGANPNLPDHSGIG